MPPGLNTTPTEASRVYVRVQADLVVDVVVIHPNTPSLQERFHPILVGQFRLVPPEWAEQVQVGWHVVNGVFAPPQPPPDATGPAYLPVYLVRERLEAVGKWADLANALSQNPAAMLKVTTLQYGVDPEDPEVIGLLMMIGADPAAILAPVGSPGPAPEPEPAPAPEPAP